MVVIAPSGQAAGNGPRPINLNKDVPQVLRLLKTVFAQEMGRPHEQALQEQISQLDQPAFLWRLNPLSNKLSQGYVWEENGRIVGNITVILTKVTGRYLIVNVAVDPDHRRRGIARRLMNEVLVMIARQGGREILLQVVRNNHAAIDLYNGLNFETLGHMTEWECSVSRLRDFDIGTSNVAWSRIRELRRDEWQAAYALDQLSLPPALNWPEPLARDIYRRGFWRWLDNISSGRQAETWVINTSQEQLVGLVSIWSEWGRSHRLRLRIQPQWQGQLERPLLAKAIARLHYMPRRGIIIDHLADDPEVNKVLPLANFRERRTLTHMRLQL